MIPITDNLALDDDDPGSRAVVVVEARVVLVQPADEPRREMCVAVQFLVVTPGGIVPDEVDPQLGTLGELRDDVEHRANLLRLSY